MKPLKRILTDILPLTIVAGIAIQVFFTVVFLTFAQNWPKFSNVLVNPDLNFALTRLIPGSVHRLTIGIVIGAVVMSGFYFLESRRWKFMTPKSFICASILSFLFYLVILSRTLQFPVCVDDAYIDFRYVFKWVNGLGFDYNDGERILGYTSALHLGLLALSAFIINKTDIAMVSQMVNTVLQCATLLLLYLTTRNLFQSNWMAVLSCAIFAWNPVNLAHSISGKEAPLVTFLTAVALFAFSRERNHLFAWSTALMALTRPEGMIWFVFGIVYQLCKRGRQGLIRCWLGPILVVALLYVCNFAYFGTVVPHGAIGRSTMFHSAIEAHDRSAFYILELAGRDIFGELISRILAPNLDFDISFALQGALAFLLLFELGRRCCWLRFYAYPTLLLLLFYSWFDPFVFAWYYAWFALLAPLVVPLLVKMLIVPIRSLRLYQSLVAISILACLVTFNSSFASLPPARLMTLPKEGLYKTFWPILSTLRSYPFAWNEGQERLTLYRRAAEYISNTRTKGEVATWEPGVVGFVLAKQRILDLGGLVCEQTLKYYPAPNGERSRLRVAGSIPVDSVKELRPEWCLFYDCFADDGLLSDDQFLSEYEMEKFYPSPFMNGRGLCVFHRSGGSQ